MMEFTRKQSLIQSSIVSDISLHKYGKSVTVKYIQYDQFYFNYCSIFVSQSLINKHPKMLTKKYKLS